MQFIPRLKQALRRVLTSAEGRAAAADKASPSNAVLDEYVGAIPSAKNAMDVLPGWHSALPADAGVTAGFAHFYNDERIVWAIEQFGSLAGRRVLELGPLEAGHTWMLEQQNPQSLDAIEANKLSYLRCLIVKEVLGMRTARFHLGNFVEYLNHTTETFDLIIASGVLYHMQDPVNFIQATARHTDALYLWTHYISDTDMPPDDRRRGPMIGEVEVRDVDGVAVRLHDRSYWGAWTDKSFCGGIHDLHRWMDLDSIMALLKALGLSDIRTAHHQPGHQNGPAISIFARRPAPT